MRRTLFKNGRLRRFAGERKGATAIEFSFVFPIFIGLVLSVFEVGLYFYKVSVVEEAVSKVARDVRVGTAFEAADPMDPNACLTEKECLYERICKIVDTFGTCSDILAVEVTVFSDFAALAADTSTPVCASDTGYDAATVGFNRGGTSEIVRIRACFETDMINPFLGLKLGTTPEGTRKIVATQFVQNEPY